MKRSEAREQAFCVLFEQAVSGETVDEILHTAAEARDFVPNSFAESEAFGVEEHKEEIDNAISEFIRGWSLTRLSKVTVSVLRLAAYEIMFDKSIPGGVSINEAVELAKQYGGKDDAQYVNGVLGSLAKKYGTEEEKA